MHLGAKIFLTITFSKVCWESISQNIVLIFRIYKGNNSFENIFDFDVKNVTLYALILKKIDDITDNNV